MDGTTWGGQAIMVPPFAMAADWGNVITDYSASGVLTSTTTVGPPIAAGSISIPVVNASTFKKSHGISILDVAGLYHTTTISAVNTTTNTITLDVATVTTIATGAVVYHDDTVSWQSMFSDSAKYIGYAPPGSFIISESSYDAILAMTRMGKVIVGSGFFTGGRLYKSQWAYGANHASVIYVRNATKNALHMGSSGTTINGISFLNHASITPTAGSAIVVGVLADGGTVYESSSANFTRDHNIINCEISGCYDGITAHQDFQLHVDRTNCENQKRYGLKIDRKIPYGGDDFTNMAFSGIGGSADVGAGAAIFVNESDWNRFVSPHSNENKYGFYHNLSTINQGQQIVNGLICDGISAGGYGVYEGGASVQGVGDVFSGAGRMLLNNGTGFWNLGTNSRRNKLTDFVLIGSPTNVDTGTGNLTTGNTT